MKLIIEMDLDNAAFEAPAYFEVGRILDGVAARLFATKDVSQVHMVGEGMDLRDENGNKVGFAVIRKG